MPKKKRTESEILERKQKHREYARNYSARLRSDPYRYMTQLERNRKRYHDNIEKSREAGRKRAAKYRASKKKSNNQTESARVREWQRAHPLWVTDNNDTQRCRKQGISRADYAALLESQHSVCAICGRPETKKGRKYLKVHKSGGLVRGLLCHSCDAGIQQFDGNYTRVLDAAEYLIKHSSTLPQD